MFMKFVSVFMIYLVSTISFSLYDVDAARRVQNSCCEKTKSGASCVYTDSSQCDDNFRSSLTTCENTNFCQIGTCINSVDGICYDNVAKAVCETQRGQWTNQPSFELDQCKKGCCQLSDQCSFTTQNECKREASKFPFVNLKFNDQITSELECVNSCLSSEKGACVSEDKSCLFQTREECGSGKFYPDTLCSNSKLGTNCARQQYTSCLGEDVYWFDSCGNAENIYDANKDKAYNNGFVLDEIRSCQIDGAGDLGCGNCDYASGSLCGNVENGIEKGNPESVVCKDLRCAEVTENRVNTDASGNKEHGESWCLYDSQVGFGKDLVGSRHVRASCIAGEEIIEPCRDFREEFCVQAVSGGQATTDLGSLFKVGQGYSEASCKENRFASCSECNKVKDGQGCCEDVTVRDCYWMPSGITKQSGTCVPMVKPGLRFWDTQTGETKTEDACSKATQVCEVSFVRGGAGAVGLGIGGIGSISQGDEWECVNNCHCLNPSWVVASQNVCRSQGDCGAWYNIEGKLSTKGISGTIAAGDGPGETKPLKDPKGIDDFSTLVRPSSKDDPTSTGKFFGRMAPGLGSIFAGGIVGAGVTGLGSAGFFAGVSPFAGTAIGVGGRSLYSYAFNKPLSDLNLGNLFARSESAEVTKLFSESFKELPVSDLITETSSMFGEKGAEVLGTSFANAQSSVLATNTAARTGLQNLAVSNPSAFGEFTANMVTGNIDKAQLVLVNNNVLGQEAAKNFVTSVNTQYQSKLADEVQKEAIRQVTAESSYLVGFFQVLNTIAWIYTIYQIADFLFKQEKTETYTVECKPWVAPFGGDDCSKCGEDGVECSEYRCRSLGSSCRLINDGTEEQACVAQKSLDTNSPILIVGEHRNLQINEAKNQGYTITTPIEPFTPVELRITTDEPSVCKFDTKVQVKFDDMANDFGSSLYVQDHKMLFSLPGELAEKQALDITNGGRYNIYVRCEDVHGNSNNRDYYVRFQIKQGSDLTPVKFELTSIDNGAFIPANVTALPLDVYLNEPAECKWSAKDTDYDLMENLFVCASDGFDYSSISYGLYKCSTILSGLKRGVNDYFFRCKDQPTALEGVTRNVNKVSEKYSLVVTSPLQITEIKPQGDVFDVRPELVVSTVQGARSGVAICGYSTTSEPLVNMPLFLETNSSIHRQPLSNLRSGPYTLHVSCVDEGGNVATTNTRFNLRQDVASVNLIERVYRVGPVFRVETSQKAVCQYSEKLFSFGEGLELAGANTRVHEQLVSANSYSVVCKGQDSSTDSVTLNF